MKKKKVRISSERLNSYGTRILTDGIDLEQYRRNPVLLYMHERGRVIGYVADLTVENGELYGDLVFDEASELSVRCRKQWEFGSLKMVSVGLDILEMSEDPAMLVAGQTSPTITRSKLVEVSVVDIGANDDAIVLRKDGVRLTLAKDGGPSLPLIDSINPKNPKQMNKEELALQLGLPKDADEAAIKSKLAQLQAAAAEHETLLAERDALRAARIESLVDGAIAEKKFGAEKKQHFLNLGAKVGADDLEQTLAAMSPQTKLSQMVGGASDGPKEKTFAELTEQEIIQLKRDDPEKYKRLYAAEYGIEITL